MLFVSYCKYEVFYELPGRYITRDIYLSEVCCE